MGVAESGLELASAAPVLAWGLATDTDATVAAVGCGIAKQWEDEGALGFTPVPQMWNGLKEMYNADSAYDAGKGWGHTAVATQEAAAMVVGGGSFVAEQAAKQLAVRGILATETSAGRLLASARSWLMGSAASTSEVGSVAAGSAARRLRVARSVGARVARGRVCQIFCV